MIFLSYSTFPRAVSAEDHARRNASLRAFVERHRSLVFVPVPPPTVIESADRSNYAKNRCRQRQKLALQYANGFAGGSPAMLLVSLH